jgi:hypothetical protein
MDIISFLEGFKKPKMWSALLYITFFVLVLMRKYGLAWRTMSLIFLVYLIRHKRDGRYKYEMFVKDLMKGMDSSVVKEHYKMYVDKCHFSKKLELSFEEWKADEIKKLEKRKAGQNE